MALGYTHLMNKGCEIRLFEALCPFVSRRYYNHWNIVGRRERTRGSKLLLDKHAVDADSRDRNGQTPLSWSAEKGYTVVVRLLLDKHAVSPNSWDNKDGQTPGGGQAAAR